MFKMIVVICTLGNPCVQFLEDPPRSYATQNQCMTQAQIKQADLEGTLKDNGFLIEDSGHYCVQDYNI